MFYIKKNYKYRKNYKYFDARESTDKYQDDIYKAIKKFVINNKITSILDVGCGSAFKLLKYFSEFNISGTDVEPTLSFLKKTYSRFNWYLSDFESVFNEKFDIIFAIDVIEHLENPDDLMRFMKNNSEKYVCISTPERDSLTGGHDGPPLNQHHIREWSFLEFKRYVEDFFTIIEHGILSSQYIIAENKKI